MRTRTIRAPRRRSGFSLTEVLVAMTLLSVIFMGLARVTFQMASASKGNDTIAKRNSVLVQEANKFNAIPFDSLATVNTTTRTMKFGDFSFTRRLTITTVSAVHRTIKIVIVPTLDATKKDSVFVTRTKPAGSPLCTTC